MTYVVYDSPWMTWNLHQAALKEYEYKSYLKTNNMLHYTVNEDKILYFIYGTLKRGHRNHFVLPEDKRFSGLAKLDDYTLYEVTYGVPGIIPASYNCLEGELWYMGAECQAVMKVFEAGYIKKEVTVHNLNDGKYYTAYTWVWPHLVKGKNKLPGIRWDLDAEYKSYNSGLTEL